MSSHVSGHSLSLEDARLWARAGVLGALALVLGYIETFIPVPVPIPGVKLGLGNIVVLMALELLDVRAAAAVATVKVLAAGFLFGNPIMMLYSAAGTLLSFIAMAALSRVRGLSVVLVAIVGAVLHNIGQLAVATVMLSTPLVWVNAPLLVIAGCITGAVTGLVARSMLGCLRPGMVERQVPGRKRSGCSGSPSRAQGAKRPGQNAAAARPKGLSGGGGQGAAACEDVNGNWLYRLDVRAKLLFLVVFVVAALHARTPAALAVCLACSLAVSVAAGVTGRDAVRVLKPLLPIVVITLAAQLLASQQTAATATDAVVWLGPFGVTARALYEAVRMVASLLAIMLMSVAFMRATGQEELVDAVRWLLSPLRVVGVRTDAFVFSLAAAIRFIPVLLDDFARLKRAHVARGASFDGGARNRLKSYVRLFAPLVNGSFRRADTLAAASVARGLCCSDRPTSLRVPHFGVAEAVVIAASAALMAFVLVA